MTTTVFYSGPDSQGTSGPYVTRRVPIADIWPEGLASKSDGAGNMDVLEAGMHMAFACGPKANRPVNPVGVSLGVEGTFTKLNFALGYVFKAYVANITGYVGGAGSAANAWDASLAFCDPVFVDDSVVIASGVTLSRAVNNDAGNGNPLCGFIWYDQTEYEDTSVGGIHATAGLPKPADPAATAYVLVSVFLHPGLHY